MPFDCQILAMCCFAIAECHVYVIQYKVFLRNTEEIVRILEKILRNCYENASQLQRKYFAIAKKILGTKK